MSHVAREFAKLLAHIRQAIDGVDGWLTDREIQFLALAGARPTCAGDVLEIGSYRGRSDAPRRANLFRRPVAR